MQIEATDAFDLSKEPGTVRELYGDTRQGRQMLIARRLVERGVRFVQVWAGGWDHHQDLEDRLPETAREIDKPAAALLTRFKTAGAARKYARSSGAANSAGPSRAIATATTIPDAIIIISAFSIWLAGGGVKGGTVYGATDEFGARAVEGKSARARLARDRSASAGFRSRAAHLPVQRAGFSIDGQLWQSRQRHYRLEAAVPADVSSWASLERR